MGSREDDPDSDYDEWPQRSVELQAFWIDQTEVSSAQFATFLNTSANQQGGGAYWLDTADPDVRVSWDGESWRPHPGFEQHPVVEVTWYGAKAFCEWAGGRLPTEAEWEKAARGTDGRSFPWGEGISCDQAQFGSCSGEGTIAVGSKPAGASPYGLLDMAGNAWEWVADLYVADYYLWAPLQAPTGPDSGDFLVLRGGSWYHDGRHSRTANRRHNAPTKTPKMITASGACRTSFNTPLKGLVHENCIES